MTLYAPSLYFVGGRGDGSSAASANGGGCTVECWRNVINADITKLMTSTGGPIADATACSYQHSSTRVTKTGEFDDVETGMTAYMTGTNLLTGRYDITDVDPGGDWVEVGEIFSWGDNTDTTISIGGAIDTLSNCFAAMPPAAANCGNQYLFTNKDETFTSTLTMPDYGDADKNYWFYIVGYHETVNSDLSTDMDRGGSNYGGPFKPTTADAWVTIDGNGMSNHLFEYASPGRDNIQWRNIKFYNVDTATNTAIYVLANSYNNVFINCQFDTMRRGVEGNYTHNYVFIDCYENVLLQLYINVTDGAYLALGCNFQGSSGTVDVLRSVSGVILNCVCNRPGAKLTSTRESGLTVVANCIVYSGESAAIGFNAVNCLVIACNNIFCTAAVDDYVIQINDDLGSVGYCEYNYAYCPAGNFTVNPFYNETADNDGWDDDIAGTTCVINTDPELVDPGNDDCRLKPTSPCLNAGKGAPASDDYDGYTSIGVWQRWQQWPENEIGPAVGSAVTGAF